MNAKTIGSLFSGVGGLDLAVEAFFDAETVWHCEIEPEPSKVLAARWPGVPNLGDVTAVNWSTVEPVDILCGGFPCQDLSLAGRRSGMRPGTRSGLWADFKTAIAALKPSVVVIENVRGLLSGCAESDSDLEPCPGCLDVSKQHRPSVRALGRVLGDLAALGFDAEWGALEASAVGAPHGRFRVFVVAYTAGVRFERGWPARERWAGSSDGDFGAPVALLPTPMANEAEKAAQGPRTSPGQKYLTHIVHEQLLPTPTVNGRPNRSDSPGTAIRYPIQQIEKLLPTPNTMDTLPAREGEARERQLRRGEGPNASRRSSMGNLREDVMLLMPTPQVADAEGGHASRSGERSNELLLPGLARAAGTGKLLPTPMAGDAKSARNSTATRHKTPPTGVHSGDTLTDALVPKPTALLPTPRASDGEHGGPNQRGSKGDLTVSSAVALLPTPRASRGAASTETMYALGAERTDDGDRQGNVVGETSWGAYEPAVRRWEAFTRPAPAPTLPDGKNGAHRLSPRLPEWMLGYPSGWITDILERNPSIKAAGNSVCPQQAYAALGELWPRVLESLGIEIERAA